MDFPAVLTKQQDNNQLSLVLNITPELSAFAGHFDQFPIVPGVIQIGWVLHFFNTELAISLGLNQTYQIDSMSSLKFQHIITPASKINLDLVFDASRQLVSFTCYDENHRFSSGKLLLKIAETHQS